MSDHSLGGGTVGIKVAKKGSDPATGGYYKSIIKRSALKRKAGER
jgi:hypothetical protein